MPVQYAVVAAVVLTACAVGEADRPRVERDACYESAETVASAWSATVGELPPECLELLDSYTVELVDDDGMPCPSRHGGRVMGCSLTGGGARTVYVLEGLDEAEGVDVSAHEWVHVLAFCAFGDPDSDHVDEELWGGELDQVLGLAVASSAVGPCLGAES